MKIGDIYYDWKVIKFQNYGVICKCKCSKKQWIAKNKLIKGKSKCCRNCSNKLKSELNIKHGYGRRKNRPRIYGIWNLMLRRCYKEYDPSYNIYGARGIKVCESWHNFENFLTDMGNPPEDHFIDRIDPNGNYEPNNCRWIHKIDSPKNTRSCVYYEIDNKIMTQSDAAKYLNTTDDTLRKYRKLMGAQKAIEFIQKYPWAQRNKWLKKNHPYHIKEK